MRAAIQIDHKAEAMKLRKELAAKEKLITELANALDELQTAQGDFLQAASTHVATAKKLVNRRDVVSVAWPELLVKKSVRTK